MMNFLSNFLKCIQVKEETTVNMDTNMLDENGCALESDLSTNVSKSCEINSIISDDNSSIYDLHLSTEHLECIEGPSQLNYNNNSDEMNMIDFEELIDISCKETTKVESITEFQNIITSYQIPRINDSLKLDEVNEYLKINTESHLNDINLETRNEENAVENKIDMLKYSNTKGNTYNITNLDKNKCIGTKKLFDIENSIACGSKKYEFEENKIDIDTKKDLLLKEGSFHTKFSKETENNHSSMTTTPNNEEIHDINILHGVKNTLNVNFKEDLLFNDFSDEISLKEFKEKYFNINFTSNKYEMQDLDDNDGYNSSDFEFINENEAKIDLLSINYNDELKTVNISPSNSVTTESRSKKSSEGCSYLRQGNIYDRVIDPRVEDGEGPSGLNSQIDNSKRDYRENYSIPEGEDYLNLFRGQYNPVLPLSEILYLENKSTRPLPMNAQYEGIGFDLRLMRQRYEPDEFEAEYAEEVKESIKRILLEYPVENRKRRRFCN